MKVLRKPKIKKGGNEMLNRLCGKRFAVAMILCLTMVFSVPSGAVFADTGADSAQDSAWNQFSKIENVTDGTIRGVDLSMYQKNVEWKKNLQIIGRSRWRI